MSQGPDDPFPPGAERGEEPPPDPTEETESALSTPWKAFMAMVAVLVLLVLGLAMAVVVRLSCVPRSPPVTEELQSLPPAPPDSVGGWVDRGDSLINTDASSGAPGQKAGFDFWARALASYIHPTGDSLPAPERIQAMLDTLQVPGEVQKAVGDARLVGVTFRPRSAVRARATYMLYLANHRVQSLPLDLGGAYDVRFAAWHEGRILNVAATGMRITADGPRPMLTVLRQQGGRWTPWDTVPPPDSLGSERSQPSLEASPGSAPVFVVRSFPSHTLFDECPTCPHRYVDRIFRLEGGKLSWLSDQVEDGPYAALSGFLEAIVRWDRDEATRLSGGRVYDLAHEFGLDGGPTERGWRLQPGQQAADTVMTAVRLSSESYRFRMEFDGAHWRVVELEKQP